VVDYLAKILTVHRRADDFLGPKHLIPVIKGQLRILDHLCDTAPPALRRALMSVASQYAQFLGWLYQDAGNLHAATWWYDRTIEWALEAGNGPMVATALSMKANQTIGGRQPSRVVTLAEAAQRPEWGSPPAVHALAVQEAAYGYALLGQAEQAERRLDEVAELAARSDERKDETPWAYFFGPDFSTMQRAVVLRDIGKADLAIPMFEAGLARLPADAKRERGQYLARLARAHQRTGDTDHALTLAEESAGIAEATGSVRTIGELQRLRQQLADAGQDQAIGLLDEVIRAATGNGDHRPA
jgi:tetratricopeptide (TPR) repeat protein